MLMSARVMYVGKSSYNVKKKVGDSYEDTGEVAVRATFLGFGSGEEPDCRTYRLSDDIDVSKLKPFTVVTIKCDSTSGKNGDYVRLTALGKVHFAMPAEQCDKIVALCKDID